MQITGTDCFFRRNVMIACSTSIINLSLRGQASNPLESNWGVHCYQIASNVAQVSITVETSKFTVEIKMLNGRSNLVAAAEWVPGSWKPCKLYCVLYLILMTFLIRTVRICLMKILDHTISTYVHLKIMQREGDDERYVHVSLESTHIGPIITLSVEENLASTQQMSCFCHCLLHSSFARWLRWEFRSIVSTHCRICRAGLESPTPWT